jgi:type IV secretion system protein VirB4
MKRADRANSRAELSDSLDTCAKLQQQLLAALDRYEPELLGVYRHGAWRCSSLLEFLGVLVNGEWQRIPLPHAPINEVLATTRPFFGIEALEYPTTPSRDSPKTA